MEASYPPADGELEQLSALAVEEAAEETVEENVGAQLDALTTMVQRQLPAQHEVTEVVPAPMEAQVPELAMVTATTATTGLDPLTAPIEQVGELGERVVADLEEVTSPQPEVASEPVAEQDVSVDASAPNVTPEADAAPADVEPEEAGKGSPKVSSGLQLALVLAALVGVLALIWTLI